ncbi:MAG: S9 family peptidase [Chloroflexi bacterium]|nr:MAG: S9 family peptidase [Chloroflexota bacterium]
MTTHPDLLPIEAVATYPLPGMAIPGAVRFSPDDSKISYLHSAEGSLTRQLYQFDIETGVQSLLVDAAASGNTEENISLEEALRRERMRQREVGITQYTWHKSGKILIPLQGGITIADQPGESLRELLPPSDAPAIDPHFSPDGKWVAYVQNAELHVIPTAGGTPQQLTFGAAASGKTHGLAEFIAQEELDRKQGYWWSPDSQSLAFAEVDETHIPVYRITHQGKEAVGDGAQEDHRYPFAGMANAKVRLGVISISGSEPIWMDLGRDEDVYLARVQWASSEKLLVQMLNREQSQLDLLLFNSTTGESKILLTETSEVWINLHEMLRPLPSTASLPNGGFIWASERTGFQHLYAYDWDGRMIRPLTQGNWLVTSIAGIDTQSEQLTFTATKESPTETHLYTVNLSGGSITRVTKETGTHAVVVNYARKRFIDIHHNSQTAPTITLRSLENGEVLQTIFTNNDERIAEYDLPTPELVMLNNRDGVMLYGAIYRPPETFGHGPFPTIVSVYGGPHAQRVTNSWGMTVDMRAQYLSQLGFLVFKLDNRGSARRGLAFEGAIKHDMGNLEVQDQVDGVRWLIDQGLCDPGRVGMYGWSYGGYMAAISLARAANTFRVAVAGASVTHWDGYDTGYTERYMGTPQNNAAGYEISNVMQHIDKMEGKLLLVHGLIDENVHFRHTARLINALIHARKPYDLLLFPNERHMPRGLADRIYMEERIRDYFVHNL